MKHERRWVWMKLLVRASLFHSICFAWFVRSRTHTSEPNEWEGETKPKDSGPWDPGNEQTEKTQVIKGMNNGGWIQGRNKPNFQEAFYCEVILNLDGQESQANKEW